MKLCASCGQPLSDPPNGGKCDPVAVRIVSVAPAPKAAMEAQPKPAFWYHAPGPAWSPNG